MARHIYLCPLRWADMDSLGHVNNVTYVDYLQESRVDMLRVHAPATGGEQLAEGTVVVRHEVEFVAPLVFRFEPVRIESWVTRIRAASFTMAYEILDESPEGERRVYTRARTVLTPYVFAEERPRRIRDEERAVLERFLEPDAGGGPMSRHVYECHVRFSDVDVYGHVNNVKYFEYYQEARIAFVLSLRRPVRPRGPRLRQVVARIDVDYKRPILFRPEPYVVETWVTRVGTSSYDLSCRIVDGGRGTLYSKAAVVAGRPSTRGHPAVPPAQRGRARARLRGGARGARRSLGLLEACSP